MAYFSDLSAQTHAMHFAAEQCPFDEETVFAFAAYLRSQDEDEQERIADRGYLDSGAWFRFAELAGLYQ